MRVGARGLNVRLERTLCFGLTGKCRSDWEDN